MEPAEYDEEPANDALGVCEVGRFQKFLEGRFRDARRGRAASATGTAERWQLQEASKDSVRHFAEIQHVLEEEVMGIICDIYRFHDHLFAERLNCFKRFKRCGNILPAFFVAGSTYS